MALKTSVFLRSLELAKLTVKMATKEIQSGDFQSRLDQAKILTQSLSQLKGAAMKAGQMLSLELADYFPPEAAEILGQLQNNATAAPFDQIRESLLQELGPERLSEFQWIAAQPTASASIAQIHKAKKGDQTLALKIQHRGVAESIDSDIALLKNLATSFCKLTQRSMDLAPLFQELRDVLKQEVDFSSEAKLLSQYKSQLETLSTYQTAYFAPSILSDFCTSKLLTMTWEEGETILTWLRKNPSLQAKEQLAHLILQLYCHEFFDWGLVQTDPNFSNFLIRENGEQIGLVLLDFGSTRSYDRAMVQEYIELLLAMESGSSEKILEKAYSFGLLNPKESQEAKDLFVEMMRVAIEPFGFGHGVHPQSGKLFDFASSDYSRRSQIVVKAFVRSLKFSPPPHRILFLHRKLGGIFSLLKRLEVRLDVNPYWELMTSGQGGPQ